MLQLPFHRIFCEIAITVQNSKKTIIFQKIDGFLNLRLPLYKYAEFPRLSFETGPSSIIAILTTFFQKSKNVLLKLKWSGEVSLQKIVTYNRILLQ